MHNTDKQWTNRLINSQPRKLFLHPSRRLDTLAVVLATWNVRVPMQVQPGPVHVDVRVFTGNGRMGRGKLLAHAVQDASQIQNTQKN